MEIKRVVKNLLSALEDAVVLNKENRGRNKKLVSELKRLIKVYGDRKQINEANGILKNVKSLKVSPEPSTQNVGGVKYEEIVPEKKTTLTSFGETKNPLAAVSKRSNARVKAKKKDVFGLVDLKAMTDQQKLDKFGTIKELKKFIKEEAFKIKADAPNTKVKKEVYLKSLNDWLTLNVEPVTLDSAGDEEE